MGVGGVGGGGGDGLEPKGGRACGEEYSDWLRDEASGRLRQY